jgi:hypothetical protein
VLCAYSSVTAQTTKGPLRPAVVPEPGEPGAGTTDPCALVTVDEHLPGAFTFRIKVTESGALFLILPRRDPAQPRFWCVVVIKCAPGGLVDPSEGGWLGKQGIRREDLGGTMTAIREDVNGWLTEPAQERLLTWVRTTQATPAGNAMVAGLQRKPEPGSAKAPR